MRPFCLAFAFAICSLSAQDAAQKPASQGGLTPEETASGFVPLFDGKTGAGWRAFRGFEFPDKGWKVEDGTLHVLAKGGAGDLVTVAQYTSFDFRFAWKVSAGANSGVMYHVSEREAYPWRTGPEYQVLDDDKHQDGKNPKTAAGSLYALVAADNKKLHAVGEWNEARIVLDGDKLEHWLNGTKVVSTTLGAQEWTQLVAASKFASMPGFGKERRGHIALQDHGDDVWFKDLRIKELGKAKEELALFDGKSLKGWTAHLNDGGKMEDVWSIQDGILVCKGKPNGYLRTEESFTNYVLEVVWRWNPKTKATGNSGVLLRMVGEDKVWPKSIEAQLQHENAGDFWNIGDYTMRTDKARTKGRNTKKLEMAEKPVGEWNTYRITADGPTVTLEVNGKMLNVAQECAELAGKICLQSEGCEIQFQSVKLGKIER